MGARVFFQTRMLIRDTKYMPWWAWQLGRGLWKPSVHKQRWGTESHLCQKAQGISSDSAPYHCWLDEGQVLKSDRPIIF